MTDECPLGPTDGVALLERAITYTLGSLHLVTPDGLSRPTPCRRWDLGLLLTHVADSLAVLHEASSLGRVELASPGNGGGPALDPIGRTRNLARLALGGWTAANPDRPVSVAGAPLSTVVVVVTGAIEVAVHGWDIARACGRARPLPPPLAEELLDLVHLVVGEDDRPGLFAASVSVPATASPGDRLVGFLGRQV